MADVTRTSISKDDQEVFRFFSDASPCWFDGCKELRAKYNEDLEEMQKAIPGFQRSDLIKEYVIKVKRALGMDTTAEESRVTHHLTVDNIRMKGNQKIVSGLTEAQQEPYKFFSDESPCWFPGCAELRASYKAELKQLEENNPGCPDCLKSPIMRDYLDKVVAILESRVDIKT